MPRLTTIKLLRTNKTNLDAQKAISNLIVGEPYFITDAKKFAIAYDVDNYITFLNYDDLMTALNGKQNLLVNQTNIKSINGNSVIGSGDLVVGGGLLNFTESDYLYNTKYGVKLTPNSTQTNVDVVLQPKGTGGVIAQQPNGTTTGGNNRGTYAVDLQTYRTNQVQVASGTCCVISGGSNNKATTDYSAVGGGIDNVASGAISSICGGNRSIASGNYSVIGGGVDSTASGMYSVIGGGDDNTTSGMYSVVGGGHNNTASGISATIYGGNGALANKLGQFAHASGYFLSLGDTQTSEFTLGKQTTDATSVELFTDFVSSRLTLVNNSILYCEVLIVGKTSGAITGYKYERRVCIAKGTTAASTTLLGSVETIGTDYETNVGADVTITADTTNGSLKIMVTGIASTTINWLALVKNIEVVKA